MRNAIAVGVVVGMVGLTGCGDLTQQGQERQLKRIADTLERQSVMQQRIDRLAADSAKCTCNK